MYKVKKKNIYMYMLKTRRKKRKREINILSNSTYAIYDEYFCFFSLLVWCACVL